MTRSEDLVLDKDGVPVLTDVIRQEQDAVVPEVQVREPAEALPVNDTLQALLASKALRQRLDAIAGELVDQFRGELEELLRPAIEQVLTEVMDDSRNATFDAIRGELGTRLPALLAELLQDTADDKA
jgi:hypothetical protein